MRLKPAELNRRDWRASSPKGTIHDKWQKWIGDADMMIMSALLGARRPVRGRFLHLLRSRLQGRPVQHGDPDIAGHADGWLTTGHLIEIKSIGTGRCELLVSPSPAISAETSPRSHLSNNHIRQASLYIFACAGCGERLAHQEPPDKLLFLYECKADQAAREFVVKYDEEYLAGFLEKRMLLDLDSEAPPMCTGGDGCKQCAGLS